LLALPSDVTAHVLLLAEFAVEEPIGSRLTAARARQERGWGPASHLSCAVLAALAGEKHEAEVALRRAAASEPAPGRFLLELASALVLVETGEPERALLHLERARHASGAENNPGDAALIQVLRSQSLPPEEGFATARALVEAAARSLPRGLSGEPIAVYASLAAAGLAVAAGLEDEADAHLGRIAQASGCSGVLAGRADVMHGLSAFAQTRNTQAADVHLDRAMGRFERLGARRDLALAYLSRARHLGVNSPGDPSKWLARAQPLLARCAGARDLRLLQHAFRQHGRRSTDRADTDLTAQMEKQLATAAHERSAPDGVIALARSGTVRARKPGGAASPCVARDSAPERAKGQRQASTGARYTFQDFVGDDPALLQVLEEATRAAELDLPMLIWGESGTGKELLAQAIHNSSPRASAPFVGINVIALPGSLLESELFGYEGGAFTGARSSGQTGKFEAAGAGTLLLDEIGDMPLEMQGKLLRVLQERVVQRVGGTRNVPVRARVIATTHRDLEQEVRLGRFRLDLFHRLRVLDLRLPPLRERKGDVRLLVEHRLRLHAGGGRGEPVEIDPAVLRALETYDWPGNVRELHNLLDSELGLLPRGKNVLSRIPPAIGRRDAASGTTSSALTNRAGTDVPLAEIVERACRDALARHGGNVALAARALGIAKNTLYSRMKRFDIAPPDAAPLARVRSRKC